MLKLLVERKRTADKSVIEADQREREREAMKKDRRLVGVTGKMMQGGPPDML